MKKLLLSIMLVGIALTTTAQTAKQDTSKVVFDKEPIFQIPMTGAIAQAYMDALNKSSESHTRVVELVQYLYNQVTEQQNTMIARQKFVNDSIAKAPKKK